MTFSHKCDLTVGPDCKIADTARIGYMEHGGRIVLGRDVRIRDEAILWTCGGEIVVGDRVVIGPRCILCGYGGLRIGDSAMIAPCVQMYAQNHGMAGHSDMIDQPSTGRGITIGRACWIGANAIILDGVTVHKGAVIGAGAVVTHDVPEYEEWAGNPAKPIGRRT